MPELPEVETIARMLAPHLAGRRIAKVHLPDPSVIEGGLKRFRTLVEGKTIARVYRRAKLCLIELNDASLVAFHLKMTGRLFVAETASPLPDRARIQFELGGGGALVFSDMRRFGTCHAFAPGEIESWDFYRKLGPEPLTLATAEFPNLFARTTRAIKAALLDQTVIAGIGNIYADESLFRAGIRPTAQANKLSEPRLAKLFTAVQATLTEALAAGGSTIRDYRTPEGIEGAFQHNFNVYGKAGQPCPACGAKLKSTKIAARTSTYCPRCQKN